MKKYNLKKNTTDIYELVIYQLNPIKKRKEWKIIHKNLTDKLFLIPGCLRIDTYKLLSSNNIFCDYVYWDSIENAYIGKKKFKSFMGFDKMMFYIKKILFSGIFYKSND